MLSSSGDPLPGTMMVPSRVYWEAVVPLPVNDAPVLRVKSEPARKNILC